MSIERRLLGPGVRAKRGVHSLQGTVLSNLFSGAVSRRDFFISSLWIVQVFLFSAAVLRERRHGEQHEHVVGQVDSRFVGRVRRARARREAQLVAEDADAAERRRAGRYRAVQRSPPARRPASGQLAGQTQEFQVSFTVFSRKSYQSKRFRKYLLLFLLSWHVEMRFSLFSESPLVNTFFFRFSLYNFRDLQNTFLVLNDILTTWCIV